MNDIDDRVADALKRVSEHHLDETPLGPRGAQRVVVERVRRRWRSFLVVNGLLAVLVVSFAVLMVPRLMSGTEDAPRGDTVGQPAPDELKPPVIDTQMSALLKAVGPKCRSFGFEFKETIQGRLYRPAYCMNNIRRTVLMFSFETEEDRRAWIRNGRQTQFPLAGTKSIVTGDTWEIHFRNAKLAQEIATELDGRIVRSDQ